MRVVSCTSFGPLSGLLIDERPSPPMFPGCLRVEVTAAGVNFVDGLFVQGLYQIKPPLPFVPGNEIAGRVVEVAEGVEGWAVGDRVFSNVGLGGFASEVVVDARRVMRTPDSLTDGQAATFIQSYATAWFALHHRAHAAAGQSVLVLGAGGGVGLAAVDVAHAAGLIVIAAASSAEKRAAATERGADAVIDSSTEDVKARTKDLATELTGDGAGVDLVYDPVGGEQGEQVLRALREDGQFLVIGFASGRIPQLPANQVLLRNRRVTGVDWGAWAGRNPAANHDMIRSIVGAVDRGELHPVEPVRYPLAQAAQALQDQLDRRITGKSVLVP
ncbi:MAG: NADPH:quinone oxidoreductase family protein [Ilumatobacteraceae bacterium]